MKSGLLIAVLLAAATPSLAEAPPRITPTRDVQVIYRFNGTNLPVTYNYRTATQQSRVEVPLLGWGVFEHQRSKLTQVSNLQRTVREETLAPAMRARIQPQNMQFQRQGQRSIAGYTCTDWLVRGNDGDDGEACLTQDGVLLSGHLMLPDGRRYSVEAQSVSYTQQIASLFRTPSDYRVVRR